MKQARSGRYVFGKFLGRHWEWGVLTAVLSLVSISVYVDTKSNSDGEAEKQRIIAADRAATEKAREVLKTRCTDGINDVVAQARAALKAGDPGKGERIMSDCKYIMTDPAAKSFYQELLLTLQKIAEAAAKASEKADLAARKNKGVSIGMSQHDVLKSSWGTPQHINRTITARGTHEQWVYPGHHSYLYFENGVLTSIQD